MDGAILIAEDDPLQRQMLSALVERKLGLATRQAEHGRAALELLAADGEKAIRAAVLDLNMPIMGGLETLHYIRQRYPALPVIMLTGSKDIAHAVEAMKAGAADFISKPYEHERMAFTLRNALKMGTLAREVRRLSHEKSGDFGFEDLIGHDSGLAPAIKMGRKAAASDIPVLIAGDTGTGKDIFARAVHHSGKRAGKPFIAVNCGAIPAQLVESTLFGHEKGAFTGATEKAIGKFREAEGGTVFLDEVGELPLDAQVKLLRVLQQREVEPVGAARPVPVNVRIISATNRDLELEVQKGRFREDLYFRLNVLQIGLPPLRERKEDIALLASHFADRYCAQHDLSPKHLSRAAYLALEAQDWPGNVRALENAVHRAIVMSEREILEPGDFGAVQPAALEGAAPETPSHAASLSLQDETGAFKTLPEIEAQAMIAALRHHRSNITQAAQALGMAKSTFYKKMKDYGVELRRD